MSYKRVGGCIAQRGTREEKVKTMRGSIFVFVFMLSVSFLFARCSGGGGSSPSAASSAATTVANLKYVDVHAHIDDLDDDFASGAGVDTAIASMDTEGIAKMVLAVPPVISLTNQRYYECGDTTDTTTPKWTELEAALAKYPGRFGLLCGGGKLNSMILDATMNRTTISDMSAYVESFKTEARKIATVSGFVGFGEIAALHMCHGQTQQDLMVAMPNHALFKALVDVAAEQSPPVPIDLHLDAITADGTKIPQPLPDGVSCSQNTQALNENITELGELVTYAKTKGVKIIWSHAGWDQTSYKTYGTIANFLASYPDVVLSINHDTLMYNDYYTANDDNQVLIGSGASTTFQGNWLTLIQNYKTQFLVGTDQFFNATGHVTFSTTWDIKDAFTNAAKTDLLTQVAACNAYKVYPKLGTPDASLGCQ